MIKKSKLFKYLYENDPKLYHNLGYRAVKVYQARYGTRFVAQLIRAYGGNIFKSHWVDRFGVKHYGLPKAVDLIRSHYHMQKIRQKQIKRINRWSFYTVAKGQQSRGPRHIGFYTTLVSGKVDKVSRHGIWIDAKNHQPVYRLLNKFHSKLARQIRSNRRFRNVVLLASDTENPVHFGKSVYSHGHNHGLIGILSSSSSDGTFAVVKELDKVIAQDFKSVFGYPLVAPCRNDKHGQQRKLAPVQPLTYTVGTGKHQRKRHAVISTKHGSSKSNHMAMNAVDDFTEYEDTDYHVQTKDTSFGSFMKSSGKQRHKVVTAQLNSTHGMSLNHGISQKTADNAKASYDNYQHFVATDRWASHQKHLTSTEQWDLAQGRSISSSEPSTEQMNLNVGASEPAVRQRSQGTGPNILIIALRAVLDNLLIINRGNKKDVTRSNVSTNTYVFINTILTTTLGDRLIHSGIPPPLSHTTIINITGT